MLSATDAPTEVANARPPKVQRDSRVLVADDIEANRELLIRRLNRLGISNITQAENGRIALDLILAQPFDLVLLDIMMPIMTGFDVLEAMAAEGRTEQLPVIVISAMSEMDAVVRAIQLGAEDFLLKPFEPTLLKARITASLEKKKLRDSVRDELTRKQAELAEARNLQLALAPPPHADPHVSVNVLLEPAREVGGDLVDHVALPDGRHLLVLGDVSDKGAGAALVMARTHALARGLSTRPDSAELFADLGRAAGALNAELAANNPSCMFVTMLLAVFDPANGALAYVNCGHVPPYVRRADGRLERLSVSGGLPLGVMDFGDYTAGSAQLEPGDTVLIVSDGATEAATPDGILFDDAGIEAWLSSDVPDNLLALLTALRAHEAGGPPSDDLAALLLRFHSRTS